MNMNQSNQITAHDLAESIRAQREFAIVANLKALQALRKIGVAELVK